MRLRQRKSVQAWEANLALLVSTLHTKPGTGRKLREHEIIPRLRRLHDRISNFVNHTAATKLKADLCDKIDGDLVTADFVDGIAQLVEWRDFLAHRYLRTRLIDGDKVVKDATLVVELFQIGQAFSNSSAEIQKVFARAVQRLGDAGDPPEAVL